MAKWGVCDSIIGVNEPIAKRIRAPRPRHNCAARRLAVLALLRAPPRQHCPRSPHPRIGEA